MALGVSGVLGIELGSDQLRVIHGALSGSRLSVYDFAAEEILISNPENAAQQLGALVERKKFSSFPAALTVSGPGVVHRLLDFPTMPLSELAVVVGREMHLVEGAGAGEATFECGVFIVNFPVRLLKEQEMPSWKRPSGKPTGLFFTTDSVIRMGERWAFC